jgi:hypothetical protein
VIVELNDVGYPGSTYILSYESTRRSSGRDL